MKLLERALVGTVCTAKTDIRYGKRYPHFVGRGAHFRITDAGWRGVYAHTGDIKNDEFWTWPQVASILVSPRGTIPWHIEFPQAPKREPVLERVRSSVAALAGWK